MSKYLLILITILTVSCSNMYELIFISAPTEDGYVVYRFYNKRSEEMTVVDTVGRFNYGMRKCTESQIKEWSKGAK